MCNEQGAVLVCSVYANVLRSDAVMPQYWGITSNQTKARGTLS